VNSELTEEKNQQVRFDIGGLEKSLKQKEIRKLKPAIAAAAQNQMIILRTVK
jgi:hypothetical protein